MCITVYDSESGYSNVVCPALYHVGSCSWWINSFSVGLFRLHFEFHQRGVVTEFLTVTNYKFEIKDVNGKISPSRLLVLSV